MDEFKPTPFKQDEIENCIACNQGLMHNQGIFFYKVSVEQFVIDCRSIQRQTGLEQMIGNAAIARVMGTNEDIAKGLSPTSFLICGDCAMGDQNIPSLAEIKSQRDEG